MASTIGQSNPIRYKGYYYDTETGFYYLNSRYYDPIVCRFLNADSYNSTGQGFIGNNMYAYCLNDPVNLFDPNGQEPVAIAAIGIAAIVAVCLIGTVITSPPIQKEFSKFGNALTSATTSIGDAFSSLISKAKAKIKSKAEEKSVAKTLPPNTKTYYHVTSQQNAAQIITTNIINKGEGGYVYAWQQIPSNSAIRNSGTRYSTSGSVVIAFESVAAFEIDPTVNRTTYLFGPVRTCFPGNIYVNNPRIVKYVN